MQRRSLRKYHNRLRELEQVTGDPVVPGEVGEWCRGVERALGDVRESLEPVFSMHDKAFGAILESNLELGGKVERLKRDDGRTRDTLGEIAGELSSAQGGMRGGDTSEEPVEAMETLRTNLLTWVVLARAHEREVDHWLIESSLRDSGYSE
ncbi:MAG: hypothetical protein AAGD14_19605 [Planctomycetota bacterium]